MKNIVIIITGGVASGKSQIGKYIKLLGGEIYDADEILHKSITEDSELIKKITEKFPNCVIDEAEKNLKIDKKKLAKEVFSDSKKLSLLEEILHPEFYQKANLIISERMKKSSQPIFFEIPLLFESEPEKYGFNYDFIILAKASLSSRLERFLSRKTMDKKIFSAICKRQLPDAEKIKHADYVIDTTCNKFRLFLQVVKIFYKINKIAKNKIKTKVTQ